MLKDISEVEKKEKKQERRKIQKIESRLEKTKSLTDKDRKDIVEWFYEIGLFELKDIAFKTGRITEYQYYRLMIEDEKKEWLKAIAKKEDEIF